MNLRTQALNLFGTAQQHERTKRLAAFSRANCDPLNPFSEEALKRVLDMLEPTPTAKTDEQIETELEEYYQMKSNVLCRYPITIDFSEAGLISYSSEEVHEKFVAENCESTRPWSRAALQEVQDIRAREEEVRLEKYYSNSRGGDSFDNMGEYGHMMQMKRYDDEWMP